MTSNLLLLNIAILILLTFLMEQGLRKVVLSKSIHVRNLYWIGLMPTYLSTVVFSILLIFPDLISKMDNFLELQKYSLSLHILITLFFIGALDGEKVQQRKLVVYSGNEKGD